MMPFATNDYKEPKALCERMAYYCDHTHFDGYGVTLDELQRLVHEDEESREAVGDLTEADLK